MSEYEVVGGMLAEWTDQCTCGSAVNQGFPHERGCGLELIAPVEQILADLAELDRLRARVAELEAAGGALAARFKKHAGWVPMAWHLVAASPDDAPTSTARHTEWLTFGTEDGDEGVETFETEADAQRAADRWLRRGMTDVYVERHDVATTRTVSTTTRTTDWEAEQS